MKKAKPKSKGRVAKKSTKRTKSGRRKENAILRYFRQTWAELKKVRWPSRREATNLTLIVLVVTVVMSLFLGVVDMLSDQLFGFLVNISG